MGDIVRRVSKANPKLSELVIPEGTFFLMRATRRVRCISCKTVR